MFKCKQCQTLFVPLFDDKIFCSINCKALNWQLTNARKSKRQKEFLELLDPTQPLAYINSLTFPELTHNEPFVYGLFRLNKYLYIGSTDNLAARFRNHNSIACKFPVYISDEIHLWSTIDDHLIPLEYTLCNHHHPTYNVMERSFTFAKLRAPDHILSLAHKLCLNCSKPLTSLSRNPTLLTRFCSLNCRLSSSLNP